MDQRRKGKGKGIDDIGHGFRTPQSLKIIRRMAGEPKRWTSSTLRTNP